MLRVCLLTLFAVTGATAAPAQTIVVKPERPMMPAVEQIRVSVGINLFVPLTDGDAPAEAQEDARRIVYDLAGHECAVLRETVASDCHLDSINVNVQRNFGQQRDGLNVNGNVAFRVVPK
jgi:hypothetical protein